MHVKSVVTFRANAASYSTLQAHVFRGFSSILRLRKTWFLVAGAEACGLIGLVLTDYVQQGIMHRT